MRKTCRRRFTQAVVLSIAWSSLVGQYGPETAKPSSLTPHPLLIENINVLDQNTDLYVEMLLRKLPNLKLINVGEGSLNRTRVFALFKPKAVQSDTVSVPAAAGIPPQRPHRCPVPPQGTGRLVRRRPVSAPAVLLRECSEWTSP